MQKKKILFAGLGTLGVTVTALLVVPGFIDWSKYQDLAQQKLREATGYELSIGGALRIGLLPSPHASVQNVILKKPSETEAFLSIENADVRVALMPLLSGKVEVASVTLDKPVLTMVIKKDGSDNWKPATKAEAQQVDAVTGEAIKTDTAAPAVSIGSLKINEGRIELRDQTKAGEPVRVDIKNLSVKADTLSGPFDAEGTIGYGQAYFNIDATTGGYRAGESLPVQLSVADEKGRASFRISGVVATGDAKEVQGETELSYTDLGAVLTDIGMAASVPAMKTRLSGMLTASPDKVLLTNGALELGNTRLDLKLDVKGMEKGPMAVTAIINSGEVVDLGSALETASAVAAKTQDTAKSEAKDAKVAAPKKQAGLVPADLEFPKDMKLDVQVRGKGLEYKRKKTGAFEFRATVAEGKNDLRLTLAEIPGGGDISVSGSLVSKGVVEGAADISVGSLKLVFAEWLGLADAKVFENPAVPHRIDVTTSYRIAGNTVALNVQPLSIGETKLNGTIAYTVGARPLLGLKLAGNVWTMPEEKKEEAAKEGKDGKKEEAAPAKKASFEFDPPQLPFDLKFDVALGRLVRGDTAMTDVKAAGSYDGKKLVLTTGSATVNGGTLSVTGTMGDVKAFSGLDVSAGLATSDLEGFVKAMTGKPLAFNKTIGAFSGNVKAKGDKSKMDVNAAAKALGFTLEASGNVNDPFDADIPSSVAVRVRHASFVEAVRVFSPGFGSGEGGGKPIDLSGTVAISGDSYAVTGLKGVVGASDIAGDLKAVLGKVPNYSANLTSTKLDLGALVGVESKGSSSGGASGGSGGGASAGGASSPWSREPLDTGFMKSLNVDLKLSAGTLLYGTWTLKSAKMEVTLKDGVLKASPISGNLFEGGFDASLTASSGGAKTPLNIDFTADVSKVAIGPFLSALMSSPKKMADGTGSVSVSLKGSGISSGALMSSLSGKADIKAEKPVVYGMDIDKLAANIVEAFDGGWKGVLAGFAMEGFSGGSTAFKDVDHSFAIAGGEMPVKDFKLETTNANAVVTTNGNVSFTRWYLDTNSNVNVTQPKDVPVIGLRLFGPLNNISKTVNSQALDNLLRSKIQSEIGDKVQGIVGDKLKGTAAEGIVNQVLPGLFGAQPQAQQPTPQPAPAPEAAPTPAPEAQPQTQQQEAPVEQQILNGIINQLGR